MSAGVEATKVFFTPQEVADRYHGKVTVRTLANWRSQGVSPPFVKVGGRILYRIEDVLDWEVRRTVGNTSSYKK